MIRLALGISLAALSATCGPKPDMMPIELSHLDGGADDDGGLDAGSLGWGGADCRPCDTWGGVETTGPLPMPLDELSGLAASRVIPGVFYAHNDSGDTARFFAMALSGYELAELHLVGATAVDWEDITLGPCEGADAGSCVFLGDIGDNLQQRTGYTVYRVHEPDLGAVASGSVTAPVQLDVPFEALPFVYPNGARHNAETLLSHPLTGDLYVLTKESVGRPSRVFRFPRPFTPGQAVTLIDLGDASIPKSTDVLATGGDIHPCGDRLLVRMYNRSVELRAAPDAGFESAFKAEPLEVPSSLDEPQGEAITWGVDGQSFLTASEKTGQSLHRARCVRAP
jgi:hypothetical protein